MTCNVCCDMDARLTMARLWWSDNPKVELALFIPLSFARSPRDARAQCCSSVHSQLPTASPTPVREHLRRARQHFLKMCIALRSSTCDGVF